MMMMMTPPKPRVKQEERPHTLTGDIRTHENFHSRYLEHDRTVIVYLPPGYDPRDGDALSRALPARRAERVRPGDVVRRRMARRRDGAGS